MPLRSLPPAIESIATSGRAHHPAPPASRRAAGAGRAVETPAPRRPATGAVPPVDYRIIIKRVPRRLSLPRCARRKRGLSPALKNNVAADAASCPCGESDERLSPACAAGVWVGTPDGERGRRTRCPGRRGRRRRRRSGERGRRAVRPAAGARGSRAARPAAAAGGVGCSPYWRW